MCLILVAWRRHADFPLVVAANRDEFHARPASAAAFWKDHPAILGGRDLQAQGTWLGVSRQDFRKMKTLPERKSAITIHMVALAHSLLGASGLGEPGGEVSAMR